MKKIFINQIFILLTKSSILVGGQAVIEGVMMRVPGYISTAVRNPDGEIVTKRQEFKALITRYKWLNIPIIRGAVSLFESMKIGFGTLQWSADISFPEDKQTQTGWGILFEWIMTILSIIFALSLFIFLPLGLTSWISNVDQNPLFYNIMAGSIRISIFLRRDIPTYLFF